MVSLVKVEHLSVDPLLVLLFDPSFLRFVHTKSVSASIAARNQMRSQCDQDGRDEAPSTKGRVHENASESVHA